MSLELSNITKTYGLQTILNDAHMKADVGEVTALVGKNGAGKTTTFKLICGLVNSDQGEIKWEKNTIDTHSIEWKNRLGYLAEHNPLYHDLYVKEFLSLACRLNEVDNSKKRISDIISEVGLDDHQNKKIGVLSKGYKQRVGLAQAIIHNPDILILDEPTSGLDPAQLIEIRSLIKQLSENRVVILSSHILSEVEQICNSKYLIKEGKIVRLSNDENKKYVRLELDKSFDKNIFSVILGRLRA